MSTGERHSIAMEMAKKDGYDWESLSEIYHNAYLHNADVVIEQREVKAVAEVVIASGQPICRKCGGAMWLDGKPCLECNPVGLPAPETSTLPEETAELKVAEGEEAEITGDGTGEALPEIESPKALILPHYEGDDRSLEERADEARKIIEGAHDDTGGDRRDNTTAGSRNTGEPAKPRKPKTRKKSAKRPS